jgi:hypothetical protein
MIEENVTRRTALKFAAVIALAAQGWHGTWAKAAISPAQGYGTDPNLLKRIVPWQRTLSPSQLATLAALCDIVLPAEPPHPSAKTIGAHEFLDEWVSAPYPEMQQDRALILDGLVALDQAAHTMRGLPFAQIDPTHQVDIFDQLCGAEATQPFSRRLIELVCDGYYTTREGHAAIGYVGNVALTSFPEPPPDVVRRLEEALGNLPHTLPPATN